MTGFDLASVATTELARMLRALSRGDFGERFDAVGLRSYGFAAQVSAMRPLFDLEPKAVAIALELVLVLAERRRHASRQPPELVFTRTGTTSSAAQDTAAVFSELCGKAQREVFVAGYRSPSASSFSRHSTRRWSSAEFRCGSSSTARRSTSRAIPAAADRRRVLGAELEELRRAAAEVVL